MRRALIASSRSVKRQPRANMLTPAVMTYLTNPDSNQPKDNAAQQTTDLGRAWREVAGIATSF